MFYGHLVFKNLPNDQKHTLFWYVARRQIWQPFFQRVWLSQEGSEGKVFFKRISSYYHFVRSRRKQKTSSKTFGEKNKKNILLNQQIENEVDFTFWQRFMYILHKSTTILIRFKRKFINKDFCDFQVTFSQNCVHKSRQNIFPLSWESVHYSAINIVKDFKRKL
jgi:hypothetical protein